MTGPGDTTDHTTVYLSELRALFVSAGSPPYRDIATQASRQQPPIVLGSSKLSDWLGGKAVPTDQRSATFVVQYLRGRVADPAARSRVPSDAWWEATRQKAKAARNRGGRPPGRPPAGTTTTTGATTGATADVAVEPPVVEPRRSRVLLWASLGALGVVAAAVLAVVLVPSGQEEPDPTAPPVKVTGVTQRNTGGDSSRVTADKLTLSSEQLAELNRSTGSGGWYSTAGRTYMDSIHAVATGSAFTNVTMVGNDRGTVTITGLHVVKQCQEPLTGTLFFSPNSGVDDTIRLGFNLDGDIAYAQNAADYKFSGNFFAEHVVTLTPGESRTFGIQVKTGRYYCRFTFEMTVATPDRGTMTQTIADNGRAFELSGTGRYDDYQALYVAGIADHSHSGGWVAADPATYG